MANTTEEQDIIDIIKGFRDSGTADSQDLFDRMRKASNFTYKTESQWDANVKEANQSKGKFCLTIPLIKPIIKQITGTEVENPRDIVVKNVRNGSQVIAKILTSCAKQTIDKNNVRFELSQEFEAGISTGQGVIGVFKSKVNDPKHANLDIRKLNEHSVLFDPSCLSYNINDPKNGCKYVIYDEPVDREYIELEYPDKKVDLSANAGGSFMGTLIGNTVGIIRSMTGWDLSKNRAVGQAGFGFSYDGETSKTRVVLTHTWWRKPKKCIWWYDSRKSEMDAKLLIDDKEIAAAKKATKEEEASAKARGEEMTATATQAGLNLLDPKVKDEISKAATPVFEIFDVIVNVMHHTISNDNIFLEDRVDEFNGVDAFPLVPFWAYFDNGYKAGVSEDLIGTQMELNYIHSQSLNITKNIANSGLIMRGGVGTEAYELFLEAHASEDGIILNESKAGGKIEKIQPAQIPAAHITFEQQAIQNMRLISNQRTEINTSDTQALSGKAIFLKQKASLQGSGSIFMNWNYSFTMFANLLINIIRHNDIFSEDEILEIVEKEDLLDKDIYERAKQIVIQTFEQQGIQMPVPPKQPNEMMLRGLQPNEQMLIVTNLKKEMDLYTKIQQDIEQQAIPMAKSMLLDEIHNIKKGEYNCVATLSPASETMRAMKAAELFELNAALIKSGDMPIDGEFLIKATDIDNKDQILESRREKLKQTSLQASQVQLNMAKAKQIEDKAPNKPQMAGVA